MSTVEAGWYSDPWEDGKIRFWDGTTWTDEQYDAEDAEHDVHGGDDPTPPVDHTVAPSSVLDAGLVQVPDVAPAQDPAPAQSPPTQSIPNQGYPGQGAPTQGIPHQAGQGFGQPTSAQSAPGYGPGFGQDPSAQSAPGYGFSPSAQSAPGYGPGFGQAPSAQSAPGYGFGQDPSAQSAPGYGFSPSAQSAPGYGPGFGQAPSAQSAPGYGFAATPQTTSGGVYGDYAAAGAGGYASGGSSPFATSPQDAGPGFGAQTGGYGYQQPSAAYGGPQAKTSSTNPAVLVIIGVVVVALIAVGAYFLFFSGDDSPAGTDPNDPNNPGGGGATTGALTFTGPDGQPVPESGSISIDGPEGWTGTVTVTERTAFAALATRGAIDPVMDVTGNGVDYHLDDVGSDGYRIFEPLGGQDSWDAAAALVLEPGTYEVTITDYATNDTGPTDLAWTSGLAGTLEPGQPLDVSVPANGVALVEVPSTNSIATVHTESEAGDPRIFGVDATGGGRVGNDDGAGNAPFDISANMSSRDSLIDVSYWTSGGVVVVGTWQNEAADFTVTYTN
ncbi:High molecular weight glutenin subunit x precursor [Actinomycetales bacterium JB111]|nr:High molecular weight glutenin subunit x precursor [Actinomycetales bacterium JB111]